MNTDPTTLATIERLSAKTGTTIEYLWEVLIRQAPIQGITYLIFLVSIGLILAKGLNGLRRIVKTDPDCFGSNGNLMVSATFLIIITILYLIIAIVGLPMIVAAIVNPEYWALKQIMNLR